MTPLFTLPQPMLPIQGLDAGLPVRRIYCVGRNYVAHIREMREADERDPPFFFQKPADSLLADGADLPYPLDTDDFQHEIELVAAIGIAGAHIATADALTHVLGYAVGLDMTRRDRQRDAQARKLPWEPGKSFDHSAPCSAIRRPQTIGHPASGKIALSVNGTPRQSGDLTEMIWKLPEIIAQLSRQYHLYPGDLIFTGTPSGVGPVHPGDRLAGMVESVGTLAITITARETP